MGEHGIDDIGGLREAEDGGHKAWHEGSIGYRAEIGKMDGSLEGSDKLLSCSDGQYCLANSPRAYNADKPRHRERVQQHGHVVLAPDHLGWSGWNSRCLRRVEGE